MAGENAPLREYIHLDVDRVRSVAAQLGIGAPPVDAADRAATELLAAQVEAGLLARGNVMGIDGQFDFGRWTREGFADGQVVRASGVVRLLNFSHLALALGGLPAVLKKMSRIEMAALRNSDEGRRMSKSALQQKSQENQAAIGKIEEFKMEELTEVVGKLYEDVVRVKVRPSTEHSGAVLIGSGYAAHFYDSAAALSQKYGVEVDAGWTVLCQLNVPNAGTAAAAAAAPQPIATGNQMEDAFEQIALLMNNAFRVANAPAFPALSMTPLAIYRPVR